MFNQTFGKILSQMADLLELNQDNVFRIRAFRRAALVVETYPEDLSTLDRRTRLAIPGIGKGIADMMEEFQAKNQIADHEALKKKFPEGVLQIMGLPGLGAKRAATLLKELKIDSIEKLSKAAESHLLQTLPGFGKKMEESILQGISFSQESSGRVLVTEARALAAAVAAYLSISPDIKQLELAGSARRWKETAGDLDFLCTSSKPDKAISHFLNYPGVTRVLGSGTTKASVILRTGMQCDFRVVPAASYGAALLYFTGSKEHNVRLREIAQRKGLTLNEYGLYKEADKNKEKPVAGKTEAEVYRKLGLPWIPPELREDRGEIEAGLKNNLPKLVEQKDILGDFHNHTDMTDGENTLEEMIDAARKHGWRYFYSADHSPSLTVASGLPVAALRAKIAKIRKLDQKSKDIRIFASSEVDILNDGRLDYPDDVLAELDCVVASVHSRFKQTEEEMTERICRAIKNRHVDVLGHLSGRLINKRSGYAINVERILQTAKETQTAVEINGQPDRAELSDIHVRRAVDLGVPLAVSSDAHSTQSLSNVVLAVHIARRGWAEAKHIINTKSAEEIQKWLK